MRKLSHQLTSGALFLTLAVLFLLMGCGGGGDGSDGPLAATEETFPDVVTLSTLNAYNTWGTSTGVAKEGNIVYVADGEAGLVVLRASNSSGLQRIGSLIIPNNGTAINLAKAGGYLYLAGGSEGLLVVDVSVPDTPVLLATRDTGNQAGAIAIEGNTLYLCDWSSLLVFDISSPAAPVLLGQTVYQPGVQATFVQAAVFNQVAYVAGYDQGLVLVNVSDPSAPKVIATMKTASRVYAAQRQGHYLLTGEGSGRLEIYDIQNLYPSPVASLSLTGDSSSPVADNSIYGMDIRDRYAYIANGGNGIQVVDVQDMASPFIVTRLGLRGTARAVYADGGTLVTGNVSEGVNLVGIVVEPDGDGDGIADSWEMSHFGDLTTADASSDQDGDGSLDVSEFRQGTDPETQDSDGDGHLDGSDLFPLDPGDWADRDLDGAGDNSDPFPDDASEWEDTDSDGVGNNTDADDDGDGLSDRDEALPFDTDHLRADTDGDGVSDGDEDFDADGLINTEEIKAGTDPFDADYDSDGSQDGADNCPLTPNADQLDTDTDASGDACDLDDDGDGRTDFTDTYPLDTDNDGVDNILDDDDDGDGHLDTADAYPLDDDEWEDLDGDGLGDNFPNNRYGVIDTNFGVIKLELFEDLVPLTAKNFIRLAESGFYNGLIFHRVISNFMIQGGDPNGDGTGGPGYGVIDEFPRDDAGDLLLTHDAPGILSMANSGPNTGGSQFFITLVDTPWLDGIHTVFGQVVQGMDVVNAIGIVATNSNDKPLSDVIMNSVTITAN